MIHNNNNARVNPERRVSLSRNNMSYNNNRSLFRVFDHDRSRNEPRDTGRARAMTHIYTRVSAV